MRDETRDRRDRVVRGLARLSLIGVLALMGAVFVGSAAAVGTPQGTDTAVVDAQRFEPDQEGVRPNVSPAGLMVGLVVIGGGVGVLLVGAFRPPARADQRSFADLMRH